VNSRSNIALKKIFISVGIIAALVVYFIITLVISPQEFLAQSTIEPQPTQEITIDSDKISLGKSFQIKIKIINKNDVSDILITSVGFPSLQEIGDEIEIISYDYTQSPRYIRQGEMLNSGYTSGGPVKAEYSSIEAYSRNVVPDTSYHMVLEISPTNGGTFEIYVKTIAIPHTTDLSHHPQDGFKDPQGEYVSVYTVNVNP
jgi:hypothetical protein